MRVRELALHLSSSSSSRNLLNLEAGEERRALELARLFACLRLKKSALLTSGGSEFVDGLDDLLDDAAAAHVLRVHDRRLDLVPLCQATLVHLRVLRVRLLLDLLDELRDELVDGLLACVIAASQNRDHAVRVRGLLH